MEKSCMGSESLSRPLFRKKPKLPLITVFLFWRIVCKGVNGVDGVMLMSKFFLMYFIASFIGLC